MLYGLWVFVHVFGFRTAAKRGRPNEECALCVQSPMPRLHLLPHAVTISAGIVGLPTHLAPVVSTE